MPNGDAILPVHPLRHVRPYLVVQRQLPLFGEERFRLRVRSGEALAGEEQLAGGRAADFRQHVRRDHRRQNPDLDLGEPEDRLILRHDNVAGRGETGPTAGERELMTRSGVTRTTSDVVKRTVDIEQERSSAGQKEFTDRVLKYDPKARPAKADEKNARDATGDKPVIKRPGEM